MDIKQTLKIVEETARAKKLSRCYIVGGTPRDKMLGLITPQSYTDIDLTTGDEGSQILGKAVSIALGNPHYKLFSDGHSQVIIDGMKLDFSSNWNASGIDDILKRAGIKPTPMQRELFSRDFTCDTLLMSLDLSTIYDPTGLGITDIKRKLLRTSIPVELALGGGHHKIVRIIYLAAKLGFDVDVEIKEWLKKHPMMMSNASDKFIAKKLKKACEFNINKVVSLLDECGLWKYIPAIPELVPYLSQDPGRI